MRKFVKILAYLLTTLSLVVIIAWFTPLRYLVKGAYVTYGHGESSATIDDAKFFDTELISTESPKPLFTNLSDTFNPSDSVFQLLRKSRTGALLVIYKDTVRFESYWDGLSDSSQTNSFSMAKSIVTILTQIAIQKGIIPSWETPVHTFIPELKGPYAQTITLRNLSTMTAGLDWNEHYTNAFGITAKAYYGPNLHKLMLEHVPTKDLPGAIYHYQSGATAYLGICLERATHQTLAQLASEWLWKPMGAEHDAKWHLDEEGNALPYCCFNSNARDFSKVGLMLLHHGVYNHQNILDSSFIAFASSPFRSTEYGQSFWLDDDGKQDFYYLRGILGQFVIVIPEKDLVICRLGRDKGPMTHSGATPKIVRDLVEEYSQTVSKYLKTPLLNTMH